MPAPDHTAAIAHFPKLTPRRFLQLSAFFSDLKHFWEAEADDFIRAGWEPEIARQVCIWRVRVSVEKIFERLAREGITAVSFGSRRYPRLLAELPDPPPALFVRGTLPPDGCPAIAIVGTRRATTYGKQVAAELSGALAKRGLIVVSGLALGIDGVAHRAALDVSGVTVAVLGTGITPAKIYPTSHRWLAEKIIADGGAVISEHPPDFPADKYAFPARNRLIAGLTLGTIIIEAPTRSGALITARCALDYNRAVFAVPHPITTLAGQGPNELIKQGAVPVTSYTDILDELNLYEPKLIDVGKHDSAGRHATSPTAAANIMNGSPAELAVLRHLTRDPQHIDQIQKATGLSAAALNSTLALLEIKGLARNLGGMMFTAVPP